MTVDSNLYLAQGEGILEGPCLSGHIPTEVGSAHPIVGLKLAEVGVPTLHKILRGWGREFEGVFYKGRGCRGPWPSSLKKPFHTMLKIAITGGAGTGKSTVARMFAELGAEVLDADAAAREAVAVGAPAWAGAAPPLWRGIILIQMAS